MATNAVLLSRLLLAERPSVVRLARRIVGDALTAEDIAQSLWLRIQRIADEPPIRNQRAFLYRLTVNLATDHLRRARTEASVFDVEADHDDLESGEATPERAVLGAEALRRATDALKELSPRCRTVVRMRRLEDRPVGEIADALGISRQMVWRYLTEAMNHLSDRLED